MVQDHTRRLRRAIERHAREHPLGEDYVMTTDTDIITALAHKLDHENTRLRAENAALRAGQGRWPEGDDLPAGEQVPRVISAAELHSGASVASFTDCGTPVAGIVTGEATDKVVLLIRNDDLLTLDTERRFILLEDAPTSDGDGDSEAEYPEQESRHFAPYGATNTLCGETVPRGVMWDLKAGEYADTRFTVHERKTTCPDCRVQIKWLPAGTPTPRLTVHALNTAPVGSRVSKAKRHWIKTTINGTWFRVTSFGQSEKRTSEDLLAMGLGDATLAYPEATP